MSAAHRTAAAVLVATLGACAQSVPGPPSLDGVATHWVDEPVFGGQIAVHEAGAGNARAILLVHGIGEGGSRDFDRQFAWLRQSFHVVAPDLPGFGESDKGNLPYLPTRYADALKRVADRFLGRPFVLVGHSMGAVVALRYAGTYPEDVERLVVSDAPGILHRVSSTGQYITNLGGALVPSVFDQTGWVARLAQRLAAPFGRPGLDPGTILGSPQLRETLLGGEPARIAALAVVNEDLSDALPKVQMPTLIVWGANDEVAPLRNGRALSWKLQHARMETLEGAAHMPWTEAPERLRALLEPFLAPGPPPAQRSVQPIAERRGDGRCRGERDRVFEGEYERLTIEGCARATVRYARVRELRIVDSAVTIDDSVVGGGDVGLEARNSSIVMTGGGVYGRIAIMASASRLDLAAVELEGREAAVRSEQPTSAVLSLCRIRSPRGQRDWHEAVWVTADNPL
jgi:pimeloyl-ACP methyl ester carboxylesterase